jgi:hypothetical protein
LTLAHIKICRKPSVTQIFRSPSGETNSIAVTKWNTDTYKNGLKILNLLAPTELAKRADEGRYLHSKGNDKFHKHY